MANRSDVVKEEVREKEVVQTLRSGIRWVTNKPKEQEKKPVEIPKKESAFLEGLKKHKQQQFLLGGPKKKEKKKKQEVGRSYMKPSERTDRGKKLSEGFVKKANKVLKQHGEQAAKEFIRTKRDVYGL